MDAPASREADVALDFLSELGAGGLAAGVSKTAMAPLERVKLVLQLQDAAPAGGARFRGIWDALRRLPAEQGTLSLWRGNLAGVARYFPAQALNFALAGTFHRWFAPSPVSADDWWRRFAGDLAAGGVAGAATLAVVYPLDFARTRLAADAPRPPIAVALGGSGGTPSWQFRGVSDCLTKVAARDGLAGLYRGFGVSLGGVVVYRGLFFGGYEAARGSLLGAPGEAPLAAAWALAQAVTAAAGFVSYPLDTVRRRLMMQAGRTDIIYRGALDCASKIARSEGIRGFFKGALANIARGTGGAVVLVAWDELHGALDARENNGQAHGGSDV